MAAPFCDLEGEGTPAIWEVNADRYHLIISPEHAPVDSSVGFLICSKHSSKSAAIQRPVE
jgi:hypothetical protein